jgi:hypothetical protein
MPVTREFGFPGEIPEIFRSDIATARESKRRSARGLGQEDSEKPWHSELFEVSPLTHLAGRPLPAHFGMLGVPPVCDPAYPPVLDGQPRQAQHSDENPGHASRHALVMMSGSEGGKASARTDDARHN